MGPAWIVSHAQWLLWVGCWEFCTVISGTWTVPEQFLWCGSTFCPVVGASVIRVCGGVFLCQITSALMPGSRDSLQNIAPKQHDHSIYFQKSLVPMLWLTVARLMGLCLCPSVLLCRITITVWNTFTCPDGKVGVCHVHNEN